MSASITAPTVRRRTAPIALGGLALAAALAILAYAGHGGGDEGLRMAARYSARLSFLMFLFVFLLRPLSTAMPGLRSLRRDRRGFGLAFAAAHFVHLAALIAYLAAIGEPPNPITVIFGGFGYVLLAAMALTSTDAAMRALGPARWRLLHTVGLYYLWFIFAYTYLGRVQRSPEMAEYWLLLAAAVGALAVRLALRRRRA